MMVQDMMKNPDLSAEDRFALGAAITNAKNQAKNAGGTEAAIGFDDEGKPKFGPRPVNPPIPGSMTGKVTPTNQDDWNKTWNALEKGKSLQGLDGITYIKK